MITKNDTSYLLSLDVSTTTIGMCVFNLNGKLLDISHFTPKVKCDNKIEELIKKVDGFNIFVDDVITSLKINIKDIVAIVIEEPLLKSNNANTVGTLMRFNGMITKLVHTKFNVIPSYISTYDSRKNGFPQLMRPNKTGDIVLFGGYPKDTDKKLVVWEEVAKLEPTINWVYNSKGQLKKENFDMSDAYCCGLGYLRLKNYI